MANLLESLGTLLTKPYSSDKAVTQSEIERLRYELDLMYRFIEESNRSTETEDSVREVFNVFEDVLDVYHLMAEKHGNYLRKAGAQFIKMLSNRKSLDDIKALLVDIRTKGEMHTTREDLSVPAFSATVNFQKPELNSEINMSVETVDNLKNVVLGEGEPRRSVVAVMGGGGIGKTTLVEKIYNCDAISDNFNFRAWISVPYGDMGEEEIIRLTARQLRLGTVINMDELVNAVRQQLKGKRYLLVFDDVWSEKLWFLLRDILLDDGTGSRVIITARQEAVTVSVIEASPDSIYNVKPLSMKKSWDLFSEMAFRGGICPQELQPVTMEILRMCEGLPLAIRIMAGVLLRKFDYPEKLRIVIENVSLEDDPNLGALSKIITVAFDSLSRPLKRCFMYLSIFPKESLIHKEKLLRLWIMEGFVQNMSYKSLERVAEEYLAELVMRNLVEACEGLDNNNEFFWVRSAVHEIIQKKATNRDFCMTVNGKNSSVIKTCRRVIISSSEAIREVLNANQGFQVHSMFLWDAGALNYSTLTELFKKYYLLAILEIENSPLEILPEEVGNLPRLNYMSLKNTRVKKLPKTLRRLTKLEVLDLSGSLLVELPREIYKLTGLCRLLASHGNLDKAGLDSAKGVKIKVGIGALENLQTLETVNASLSGMDVIQELKKLKKLRRLRVSRLTTELTQALCVCINHMPFIRSLHLQSLKDETLDLQTILSKPTQLQRLILKGELLSLPNWIPYLYNLRMMCLSLSRLTEDPLNSLHGLLDLESLWLYDAYCGTQLSFKTGFKKLKLLVLREMHGLEKVEIEKDTMTYLEELRIGPCPLMEEVPAGIENLKFLEVLSFYDMPDEFVLKVQPNEGSEFPKVENVPSVLFWYSHSASGRSGYTSYRLGEPNLLRRLSSNLGSDTDNGRVYWRDSQLSFSYSEDEGVSSATPSFHWDDLPRPSFTSNRSSFFTDDIED